MQNNFTFNANIRSDIGKGASRRLRRNDMIPAIIYGGGKEPVTITLEHIKFMRALENESFYTRILTLKIGDEEEKVILRNLQRHAYRPRILHIDFQRVSALEKISMLIPLRFKGGDMAPGVKLKGGIIAHLISEVEIRCLAKDLPEFIDVDLSQLDIEQTLHLSNLQLPQGTEIPGLIAGSKNDKPVASIYIPRAIAEEMPIAAPSAAAVETVAEAKAKGAEESKAESKA